MSIQDRTRILANSRYHLLKKRQHTLSLRARQEKGLSVKEFRLSKKG